MDDTVAAPELEPAATRSSRTFLRVFLAAWGLVTLASLVIFVIRANAVVRWSHLYSTTGEEAPSIYAIWKAQHGYPVYEWPDRGNYALSLYNFGFYRFYSAVLSALGQYDARILVAGRLLTGAFVVAGIGVHWGVVRRVLPRPTPRGVYWAAILTVVGLWLGRSTFSWWYLTVRPDLPGIVLSMAGLWTALRGLERDPSGRDATAVANLLVAAALYYAAWSFKQSLVLSLGGCMLYLLPRRRWRPLFTLAIPFAIGCALALALGGAPYRRNILYMPSVAPPDLKWGLRFWAAAVVPNAILFALPLLTPWALRSVRTNADWESGAPGGPPSFPLAERLRLIITVACVTLAGNGLAIFKLGAAQNYMFEPMVHFTTLTVFVLAWLARPGKEGPRALGRFAAVALAAWGAILPVLTLLFPQGLTRRIPWNLVYNREQVAQRQALVDALASAPRPMLIVDEVLSQPWHATNNRHPALVVDTMSLMLAQDKGVVPRTLMQDLLIQGKYASGVFRRDMDREAEVVRAALEHGFVAKELPKNVTGGADLVLLTRPGTAPTTRE